MSKKVLATNCTITNLPEGWLAKVNDTGTAIITVPAGLAGMFGGTITAGSVNINGFTAQPYEQSNQLQLVGSYANVDESGFHDFG